MLTLVSWILALGILPSVTALSEAYARALPHLASYTGPLNPLKIGAPILLWQVWRSRRRLSRNLLSLLGLLVALLLACSYLSARNCDYPAYFLRETSVMLLGLLAATAWLTLPAAHQRRVTIAWLAIVAGSALLQLAWPASIEWLLAKVFDPGTRQIDQQELGITVLTGIFGRQSLAKLLAWLPWLVASRLVSERRRHALAIAGVLAVGLILATTQRGPAMAALAAGGVYAIWFAIRQGRAAILVYAGIGTVLATAIGLLLLPKAVYDRRITPSIDALTGSGKVYVDPNYKSTQDSMRFRKQMNRLSLDIISRYPAGNACVSMAEYRRFSIWNPSHSHNMMLEQLRSRGWIWGTLHLLLWLLALILPWRSRYPGAGALLGAVTAVWICGLFDHPWFVLNHAMVLWVILLTALGLGLADQNTTPIVNRKLG